MLTISTYTVIVVSANIIVISARTCEPLNFGASITLTISTYNVIVVSEAVICN